MSKSVLVTGSQGQLAQEIFRIKELYSDFNFNFVDRQTLDLSEVQILEDYFDANSYDIIINCAAYTAVDAAESDKVMARLVNENAVECLADIAKKKKISLIHISTDYVFDGTNNRPYLEDDTVAPQSVYGETKLGGENAMIRMNPSNSIIIRTSWVYSSFGSNFVKTMLRLGNERDELGVIFDQVGTPTYAYDLAKAVLDVLGKLSNKDVEIYNYSNEGVCSWYDFAKAIFELSGTNCKVNPIETSAYPTPAQRPHYSLLNKTKIKNTFGLDIPYWKDALQECLKTLKENK